MDHDAFRVALVCFALTGAMSALQPVAAQPLRAPIDPAAITRNAQFDRLRFNGCARPPAPIVDHSDVIANRDSPEAVLDLGFALRRRSSNSPIEDFSKTVTMLADQYLLSGTRRPARAQCVATWIASWARGRAFLGQVTTWGRYETLWFGQIQLGMAYLKVRSEPGIPAATHAAIRAWLVDVARAAIRDQSQSPFADRVTFFRAWTAAAAAVASVAADDRELFDHAISTTRTILRAVNAEGHLPNEMTRGPHAFAGHLWALEPLALTVLIAERNGVALAAENNHALRRVVDFVLAARRDRARFEALANAPQDQVFDLWPRSWDLGFVELFLGIEPHAELEQLAQRHRPIISPFTGGDWTRTLGRAVPVAVAVPAVR